MLLEILVAAGVAAAIVATIYIAGKIKRKNLTKEIREAGWPDVIIKKIKKSKNVIKLEDMDGNKYEVEGDDISDKLHEGDMIYV